MAVKEHRDQIAEQKLHVLEGSQVDTATFQFGDEDHTLGNTLRHVLLQRPDVDFCGYSVPHPSEPKMNLRLQTTGEPAVEVLKSGLQDLSDICAMLEEKIADVMGVEELPEIVWDDDQEPPPDEMDEMMGDEDHMEL